MSNNFGNQKIALVHDWILGVGGAEKTLKALHEIFPQAPIYTLFYDKRFTDEFLPGADIRPTFVQGLYEKFHSHKFFTPLMPAAIESIDLGEFDVVISSSVIFSKGLVLKPRTRHICYCYSPTRQLWDWSPEYSQELKGFIFRVPGIKFWASVVCHFLRIWDRHASTRVDQFIAISENVRQRIRKYYGRDSTVIYPPVDVWKFDFQTSTTTNHQPPTANYFLIVGRLFKHKNIDLAIRAFNKLGWPLVIVGEGPELKRLCKLASPNIKLLGYQSDAIVHSLYAGCSAFIMPQEEDFGITPVEAMSYGKPVLALRCGGALEYIQEGINGEFFDDPVEEVLADGVRRIKNNPNLYNSEEIKKTAERFSNERFKKEIVDLVSKIETASFAPQPYNNHHFDNHNQLPAYILN